MLPCRTELLGCYSDQDFLAKLHCVRQAFEVGVRCGCWEGGVGAGAGAGQAGLSEQVGHLLSTWDCPLRDCGGLPAGRLTLPHAPAPAPQGLLEDQSNQLFFGEVGRQMVTGLMTKAEKVVAGGPSFRFPPPSACSVRFSLLFGRVKRNEKKSPAWNQAGELGLLPVGELGKAGGFSVLIFKNVDLYCFLFLITTDTALRNPPATKCKP